MGRVTGVASIEERSETQSPLGVGLVIWLASELMFFAGLFAAYFALLAENEPDWPPADVELDVWRMAIFTTVLVVSSITIHFSIKSAEQERRTASLWLLVLTIFLGALFIINTGLEWAGLDFQLDSHAYGTIFYLLTGFHALHVLGGLVALGVIAWVVFSRYSRIPSVHTLRVASYYWHFVDVVWVVLFFVVYVIQ
jgi:cytochrome c oxidase subunit III